MSESNTNTASNAGTPADPTNDEDGQSTSTKRSEEISDRLLAEVRSEFAAYRDEQQQTVEMLQATSTKLKEEISTFRVKVARAEADAKFYSENYETLKKTTESSRESLENHKRQVADQQRTILGHERLLKEVQLELNAAKEELEKNRVKIVRMETEKKSTDAAICA